MVLEKPAAASTTVASEKQPWQGFKYDGLDKKSEKIHHACIASEKSFKRYFYCTSY